MIEFAFTPWKVFEIKGQTKVDSKYPCLINQFWRAKEYRIQFLSKYFIQWRIFPRIIIFIWSWACRKPYWRLRRKYASNGKLPSLVQLQSLSQALVIQTVSAWFNELRQQIELHTNYNEAFGTEANLENRADVIQYNLVLSQLIISHYAKKWEKLW